MLIKSNRVVLSNGDVISYDNFDTITVNYISGMKIKPDYKHIKLIDEFVRKTKSILLKADVVYLMNINDTDDSFRNLVKDAHHGTIEGDGDYVDSGQRVSIGARTLGEFEVGGGGSNPEENASPYLRRIKIRSLIDKFERVKVKYVATGIGYASISEQEFHDISLHGQRIPNKYSTNNS